jgi:hypothetical protein
MRTGNNMLKCFLDRAVIDGELSKTLGVTSAKYAGPQKISCNPDEEAVWRRTTQIERT